MSSELSHAITTNRSKICKDHYPSQMTLPEYLIDQSDRFASSGRSFYLVDGLFDKKLYFKDLERETRRIASCLNKNGLRKGDVVIYLSTSQVQLVPFIVGVWRANGIVRSLYPEEDDETILEKIKESKARWIVCDPENALTCKSISNKCEWDAKVVAMGEGFDGCVSYDDFLKDEGDSCPKLEIKEDDIAIILPTSGTTGPSKGAMHSHKSFLRQLVLISEFPYTYPKLNLIVAKGTHIGGVLGPLSFIANGKACIVLPKINRETVFCVVDKYKPGLAYAFPSYLLALKDAQVQGYDVSSLEVILAGACPITPSMIHAFRQLPNVKHVMICYGLTEGCTIANTSDNKGNCLDFPDFSVGHPLPGVEVQIRNPKTLEVLDPNQQGEIFAKGDIVFQGYVQNPESTRNTLVDGWLRTGDFGYMDKNGFLFVIDRIKETFKYYNNHISPTEIENVLLKHPMVREACVVGVPVEGGEIPRAFVTLKHEFENKNGPTSISQDILNYANGKLATYKHISGGICVVEDLPKGKTGKVTRRLVSKLLVNP